LGSVYQAIIPAFLTHPDHITFEYNEIGQTTTQVGTVAYSGAETTNNLRLNVNTATGQVQLKNDSPYDVFIDGYSVFSNSNSLQVGAGQWSSLQDQGVPGWEEASPTTFAAAELRKNGAMRLTAGSGFNLGTLYNTAIGSPDLTFQFFQPGSFNPTDGAVRYGAFAAAGATSAGVLGDFNNNGVVDGADYALWKNSENTRTVLRNDPIGGVLGAAQYNLWRANFGNSTAGGAGAGLERVPEPGSLLILFSALALGGACRPGHKRGEG
jgi:hypothetical protein